MDQISVLYRFSFGLAVWGTSKDIQTHRQVKIRISPTASWPPGDFDNGWWLNGARFRACVIFPKACFLSAKMLCSISLHLIASLILAKIWQIGLNFGTK